MYGEVDETTTSIKENGLTTMLRPRLWQHVTTYYFINSLEPYEIIPYSIWYNTLVICIKILDIRHTHHTLGKTRESERRPKPPYRNARRHRRSVGCCCQPFGPSTKELFALFIDGNNAFLRDILSGDSRRQAPTIRPCTVAVNTNPITHPHPSPLPPTPPTTSQAHRPRHRNQRPPRRTKTRSLRWRSP